MRNRHGFTFVEVTLASLLFLAGMLGVFSVFYNVNQSAMGGQMTLTGMGLCEERLEQIIADKVTRGYAFVTNANYPVAENLAGNFQGFTRTTNIHEVTSNDLTTDQAGSGYKKVDVTVSWGNAASERVNASTLVAQ